MGRKVKQRNEPKGTAGGSELGKGRAETSAAQGPAMRTVVAAMAGMIAAWIAAGSVGLLAHPLRLVLTWLAVAVVLIAGWPGRLRRAELGILLGAVLLGLALTVPALAVYNVLAVALVLAVLARMSCGVDRRALLVAALAAAVLAVYRLAYTSIPAVWLAADWVGQGLGRVAAAVSGRPLWVGASFAGLDGLVLMAAVYGGWLWATARRRLPRAIWAGAAILAGHLACLVLLACSTDLTAALSIPLPAPETDVAGRYVPPPWYWSAALRTLLPWNLPWVAVMVQALVAGMMFRWASWRAAQRDELPAGPADRSERTARRLPIWRELGPVALALVVPAVTLLAPVDGSLSGRKIVAYQRGYLNWDKPSGDRVDRESAGLYGMLPTLVASLGGQLTRSAELAPADLEGADVLVLIHPTDRWAEVPERLERIWSFVRGGGSLLVVAQPRVFQEDGQSSGFDELLGPTGMEVRFDTAIAAAGSWQHALEELGHPVTRGINDQRNAFGLGESASIRARWPACPLLVGRWGWSDPGSDAVLTGVHRFDAGERLGDLVLAAEQRVGDGRVVVLGDAGCLTNVAAGNCCQFTGRLLGYLASRASGPQDGVRQALGLIGCLALVVLIAWPPEPGRLALTLVAMGLSMVLVASAGSGSGTVLPDGRARSGNYLACIDASHLEAYSGSDWHDDGIGALKVVLMREGYLPIVTSRLTDEQLQRAGVLISIAPGRAFSDAERRAVKQFVQRGGLLVATVGAEHAGPIDPLLADFGLRVPRSSLAAGEDGREPFPLGQFAAAYSETPRRDAEVSFSAAWPVEAPDGSAEVLLQGPGNEPTAVAVREGQGTVVLIGDSHFALNKSLQTPDDEPAESVRDNGRFWRWLLKRYRPGPGREAAP